jgi:PKD repeat protein
LTVQFTDLSTAQNTTITSWKWDFNNDGTIDSTQQNPSRIYNDNGTYTVSLRVSNGQNPDTEIKENYITVLPPGSVVVEIGNITAGLMKVNAEIRNNGTKNASSLDWNISLTGRIGIPSKTKSGTIDSLSAGDSTVITYKPLFGFGKVNITVTVEVPDKDPITKSVTGFLLFFIVIGIK